MQRVISVGYRGGNGARRGAFLLVAALFLVLLGTVPGAAEAKDRAGKIVVNGVALTDDSVRQLQQIYPVPIAPGRYWYDTISGAFGREGEPIYGQMLPGLELGGPLRGDASRGSSKVFINGRQLTVGEKRYIEQACRTPVVPGRYWVLANGVGGYEGGQALFNLALCGRSDRQSSGSSTRTYCNPDGSCTSSGILGSILTAPN